MVVSELTARGLPVYCVSTVTTEGLRELTFALGAAVRQHRSAQPPPEPTRVVLRPSAVDESGFEVTADPGQPDGFIVRGIRPQRWVRQTKFDNAEAVGYLADRLARLGVEDALAAAGARAGCPVTIGDVTFEWEPSTPAGAAAVRLGGRGTDWRLDDDERISAAQRKTARRARRESSAGSGEPDDSGQLDDSGQDSADVEHD
jgi:GTP-binding protein